MARHHNKAILVAIEKQQLDPTKEYVAGKNGLLTLSINEQKKLVKKNIISSDEAKVNEKETTTLETKSELEVENQSDKDRSTPTSSVLEINEKLVIKENKSKKKIKEKI